MTRQLSRVLAFALAALIGAVYGTAATIAHAYTLGWVPIGLVLALGGCAALLVGLRLLDQPDKVRAVGQVAVV